MNRLREYKNEVDVTAADGSYANVEVLPNGDVEFYVCSSDGDDSSCAVSRKTGIKLLAQALLRADRGWVE